MTAAPTLAPSQTAGHPGRWHALMVSQLAAFMALLDVSIVNVALPSIQNDLGAAPATAQWVVSGYSNVSQFASSSIANWLTLRASPTPTSSPPRQGRWRRCWLRRGWRWPRSGGSDTYRGR